MTSAEKNDLIENNMGLVYNIVNKDFRNAINKETLLEREDLVQTGCIGLMKAADTFKPELGFEFTTYAYKLIKNEIVDLLRSTGKRLNSEICNNVVYMDAPLDDHEDTTYGDMIADSGTINEMEDWEFRESYMDILNEIEQNEKTVTELDVELLDMQIQGYTPKDISAVKGIDCTDVSLRLSALRRKIRTKYSDKFTDLLKNVSSNTARMPHL